MVNHALQLEFKRADLETRKFVVNTVAGLGGILRDTMGMAGDNALNPVSWLAYGGVTGATALAISGPNAAWNMNSRMNL